MCVSLCFVAFSVFFLLSFHFPHSSLCLAAGLILDLVFISSSDLARMMYGVVKRSLPHTCGRIGDERSPHVCTLYISNGNKRI